MYLSSVLYFIVFEYRVNICMCVCFHFTAFVSVPSELFLKGQALDIQSVVEFMVSSEWLKN